MTDLERVELAIRRAASQMRGDQSRAFRLVADELASGRDSIFTLEEYRMLPKE